jgi:hypothetical protein
MVRCAIREPCLTIGTTGHKPTARRSSSAVAPRRRQALPLVTRLDALMYWICQERFVTDITVGGEEMAIVPDTGKAMTWVLGAPMEANAVSQVSWIPWLLR